MYKVVCALLIAIMLVINTNAQTVFYVSPMGNDNDPGTIELPFKTISKARDVVRTVNSNMTGDIFVFLRGGTFVIDETLTFTPSDNGTNGFSVYYKAYGKEVPEISGGKTITGWSQYDGGKNIYRANIGTSLHTRHLYVDGVRAIRACGDKFPGGFGVNSSNVTLPSSGIYAGMGSWGNISNIEIIGYQDNCWKYPRCPIASILGNIANMASPGWKLVYGQAWWAANQVAWVENAYELLDVPGEFYINRTDGYIYYIPRDGQSMSSANSIIPKLETLVHVAGSPSAKVSNIKFEGLSFAYTTWLRPNTAYGFPPAQASMMYDEQGGLEKTQSSVKVNAGNNIGLLNCVFHKLGNVGLDIDNGSNNCLVSSSVFTDISSEAIVVGNFNSNDHHESNPNAVTKDNSIYNNYIADVGTEYKGNPGISVGYTDGTNIDHNTLVNLPYSGICVGWGHGTLDDQYTPTAKNNRITNNYISNYMRVLRDGGGIYTLGQQNNSFIQGNYIERQNDVYGYFYLDNGTAGYDVNYNLCLTKGASSVSWGAFTNDNCGGPDYFRTHNNKIHALFYDQSLIIENRGTNNEIYNNYPVDGNNLPPDAQKIIDEAGCSVSLVDGASVVVDTKGLVNVALYKPTSQSSTWPELDSYRAVDGRTSGTFNDRDLAHTNNQSAGEWWMVDLGGVYDLTLCEFWNRADCCVENMDNYTIQRSYDGKKWVDVSHQTSQMQRPSYININASARYIRLLQNKNANIHFAEAKIYTQNLAYKKVATQSTTYQELNASHAVDGITTGNYDPSRDLAHSNAGKVGEWWMVDLGETKNLGASYWWNRADCCGDRMNDYTLQGSLDNVKWTDMSHETAQMGRPTLISVNLKARYVKFIQNKAVDFNLSEVEIPGVLDQTLQGIKLSSPSSCVAINSKLQLSSELVPAYANNTQVSYTSDNIQVAIVDQNGVVTGVAIGKATITVTPTDGNFTASCTVNVLQDITETPGTLSAQYTDSPNGEGYTNLIDNNSGTKFLTSHNASWVQFQANKAYVVTSYSITSANDSPDRDPLNWTFQASNDGTGWTSIDSRSDIDFPSRNQNLLFEFSNATAYKYYRLNITNNSGSTLQLSEIEIFGIEFSQVSVKSISLPTRTVTLKIDSTYQLVPIVLPANASNKNVTYKSDNPLIASVDDNGIVTAKGVGVIKIVIQTEDGNLTDFCNLTVIDLSTKTNKYIHNCKLSVYHNPTDNSITIQNLESKRQIVELFDVNGKLLQSFNMTPLTISLSKYPTSIYILKIITDRETITKKIIIN